MKTPTLIVRITGIYMVVKSLAGVLTWWEMKQEIKRLARLMGDVMPESLEIQKAVAPNILLLSIMLLAGILIAWHSGVLARLLTFDAEQPGEGR